MLKCIYVRGLRSGTEPARLATDYAGNGINMVLIKCIGQDPGKKMHNVNTKLLSKYVKEFDDVGITCGIWGYPWGGMENKFVERLSWCIDRCEGRIRWICLDPELGYKYKIHGMDKANHYASMLVNKTIDVMDESMNLIVTSYGVKRWHPGFPWDNLLAGVGSPQFYKATESQIQDGIEDWKNAGWDSMMPSIPSYGPNSGEHLVAYTDIIRAAMDTAGAKHVGWIIWSDRQMDRLDWDAVRTL